VLSQPPGTLCRRGPSGLDRADCGTHSMRGTKATLIYRRTKSLRAVQLLLGHSKLESTVRYLGIEVDDALEISEQTDLRRTEATASLFVLVQSLSMVAIRARTWGQSATP
jgi:integrase